MKRNEVRKLATRVASGLLAVALVFGGMPTQASASSDLDGNFARSTIEEWTAKGLVKGYSDGTFRPDAPVTRIEFSIMVNRSLGLTKTADIHFKDVSNTAWYYNDLMIAAGNQYVTGYEDGNFGAGDNITREQAAVMVQKAKGLDASGDEIKQFTDKDKISKWAESAVSATVSQEYFSGYPDGSFGADRNLTRAEAVSILDRAMKKQTATAQDVTVDTAGTVIKGRTIEGNLILSGKIGSGSVTIEDTTIKGDILVNGGGSNSIHLKDSAVDGEVCLNYSGVRLVVEGKTKVENMLFQKTGKLDADQFTGSIGTVSIDKTIAKADTVQINAPAKMVEIDSNATVKITSEIQTLTVGKNAEGAKLDLSDKAKVTTLQANAPISITGKGKISTLEANTSGITTEIKPDKTNTSSDATKPSVIPPSGGSTGGGSSSGGGSGSTQKELKVEDFVLYGFNSLKVKLNYASADLKFTLKDLDINKDMYIYDTKLEEDGYYYIHLSYEAGGDFIRLEGNYQLAVSGSGYKEVAYNFKGSQTMDDFLTSPKDVRSITTESGRNQLEIKIAGSMNHGSLNGNIEDVAFTVMEDGVNILSSATVKPFEEVYTVYTLDLSKEVIGGNTYTITLDKEGFNNRTLEYVPVSSIRITNKEAGNWVIPCGDGISGSKEIHYEIQPSNATMGELICEIEDESIIHHWEGSYIPDGFVLTNMNAEQSTKEGSTKVKIVSPDGGLYDEVTITAKRMPATNVDTLRPACMVRVSGTNMIMAWVDPPTAFNKNLIWSCADTTIATLEDHEDIQGKKVVSVNGLKLGLTTVTATAADDSGASADVKIFVYEDNLAFTDSSIQNNTITKGAVGQRIRLNIMPGDSFTTVDPTTEDQVKLVSFDWKTSTPDLITVDWIKQSSTCTITPTGETGTAKLTCRYTTQYGDSFTAEMEITITD